MYCQKCGAPLAEGVKFCAACGHPVGEPVMPVMEPASMGKRFLNYFLDAIGLYLFIAIVAVIIGIAGVRPTPYLSLIGFFSVFVYTIFFESIWQRTPGKWITGTKVVREDGSKPKFLRIVGRTLCRIIPFEQFSFFADSHPVGWHDRFSHTLVVPKSYTADDVKKIDLSKRKGGSTVVVIIACVFGGLIFLGIVSTVVLSSLGAARSKAQDAKVEGQISTARAQAELYYSENNGSYLNVCTGTDGIQSVLEGTVMPGSETSYVCNDTTDAWAASAPLSAGHQYACSDSLGDASVVSRPLDDSSMNAETVCPVPAQ